MSRKTFDVAKLKASVNRRNCNSVCSADKRAGWNQILEEVLHATGNYKGFRFLPPSHVPEGQDPGIQEDCGDFPLRLGNDNDPHFEGTDNTRRKYY